MKHLKWIITLLLTCCLQMVTAQESVPAWVSLGSGFFYDADSSNPVIYYQPSYDVVVQPKDSLVPKVNWPIIEHVSAIGIHEKYVLVVAGPASGLRYFYIDKTQEAAAVHNGKAEQVKLNNVYRVDMGRFKALEKELNIRVEPYRP